MTPVRLGAVGYLNARPLVHGLDNDTRFRVRYDLPSECAKLLHAHEIVLQEARAMARRAEESDDAGTNDLIVGSVIRRNELHVWFVAEHAVDVPIVRAV